MRRLNSFPLRNLWSRKLRTLITGVGIVLGVATVLAFGITNATVENSLDDFFSQTAGDADLTISSNERDQTFRERALQQAVEHPDVILAVGSLWQGGTIQLPDEEKSIVLAGIDPHTDPQVRSYQIAEGRMIKDSDRIYTIVLVASFAEDNDIHLGDDLDIDVGEGHIEEFEVVGLLKSEGAARFNNGAVGFLRLDVVQELFDEGGRLSQIDVVVPAAIAANGPALDRFKQALADYMGGDYAVAYPGSIGQAITDSMSGLRTGLGIFSTIALFVGAMLIYNTFTMTVTERTAEIGMLRAIGATRRQVLRLILVEAVLMGFIGSVSGLGLGIFLAIPLVQMFARGFGGIPLDRFTVPPVAVVEAILLGTIVTLVSAFIPAWQAGRISPVEAMRARSKGRQGFIARHSWKIGLVLMAFSLSNAIINTLSLPILWLIPSLENGNPTGFRNGLSALLLVIGLFTMAPRFWTTVLRLVGKQRAGLIRRINRLTNNWCFRFCGEGGWVIGLMLVTQGIVYLTHLLAYLPDASFFILMFTGGTLVVPVTIQYLEKAARYILSMLYGAAGGLGSRNLDRARGRTSLTIGVLMVGATMTIAIGSIRAAFDQTMTDWVNTTLGGDLIVSSQRGQRLDFANQLMTIPGVELATPFEIVDVHLAAVSNSDGVSIKDDSIGFQAVDLPAYRQVAGFQFVEEAEREDEILARLTQGNAVLISSVLSDKFDIGSGDHVRLRTRRGERDFEVVGIVSNFNWGGNCVIGIWSDMEQYLGAKRAWVFLVKLAADADVEMISQVIETRLSRNGDFEVESAVEFRETISQEMRNFIEIFNVVVYIAVLVAGLGVVNTMTMNILERVREIGLLRSIGMTRRQIANMVLAEAGAMGVLGGVFGLGIGWLIAEDMVVGMSRSSGWHFDFVFPAAAFISAAITALVVSQLAAIYPVWRAGGMRIVDAIQHE